MEPEGSLQFPPPVLSWASSIQSKPPHPTFPEDPSQYYPLICAWVFQVVYFLQVSPPKPCICLSSPPYALHAPPISLFSILSPARYWVMSTDLSAPHYVIFSIHPIPRTVWVLCFKKKSFAASVLDDIHQGGRDTDVKLSLNTMKVRKSYCTFWVHESRSAKEFGDLNEDGRKF